MVYFSGFGMLRQEKSGNPERATTLSNLIKVKERRV
jgi:hypothetical protein